MDRRKIMMWSVAARLQPQMALQALDVDVVLMIMHSGPVLTCTEALDIEVLNNTDCSHQVVYVALT
jgi:nucleoside phosphorylase